MRPIVTKAQTFGNLSGRQREMAFDASSFEFIMNTLTELYNDPLGAVVREYSTNALDSHIEAGVTTPIDIRFNDYEYLEIEDYGIGMSEDDLFNTYALYGASSKRDSDDVAGMLGLGSKSALAFTDSFTVRGRKDGVETIVLISKNERGIGEMHIVNQTNTNSPDGVLVRVPLDTHVRQRVTDYSRYLRPGIIRINGRVHDTTSIDDDAIKITDDIYLLRNTSGYYYNTTSYVVMGNVAYPVDTFDNACIVYVPVGTVEPMPSRDGLKRTKHTEAALKVLSTKVSIAIAAHVDSVDTGDWQGYVDRTELSAIVSRNADVQHGKPVLINEMSGRITAYSRSNVHTVRRLDKSIVIKNWTNADKPNTRHRERARMLADKHGYDVSHVVWYDKIDDENRVKDHPRLHDYSEVLEMKLPTVSSGSGTRDKIAGYYKVYDVNTRRFAKTPANDVIDKDIVVTSPADTDRWGNEITISNFSSAAFAGIQNGDVLWVQAGANRWDKLKRISEATVYTKSEYEDMLHQQALDAIKAYDIGDGLLITDSDVLTFIFNNIDSDLWNDEVRQAYDEREQCSLALANVTGAKDVIGSVDGSGVYARLMEQFTLIKSMNTYRMSPEYKSKAIEYVKWVLTN